MNNTISSMLALACGDSYGKAYELKNTKVTIEDLPNYPADKSITDDTHMAYLALQNVLQNKQIDTLSLLEDYKQWAMEFGYAEGIGIHTADVLLRGKTDKISEGNASLMRCLPYMLALKELGFDDASILEQMKVESALTHCGDVIIDANMICYLTAINKKDVVIEHYLDTLEEAFEIEPTNTAWVINTLNIILDTWKDRRELGFLNGFKKIVSMGGDTDTNCAVYGAMFGFSVDIRDEIDIEQWLEPDWIEKIGSQVRF
jgi:ADP-ribosylglycohydrolase